MANHANRQWNLFTTDTHQDLEAFFFQRYKYISDTQDFFPSYGGF